MKKATGTLVASGLSLGLVTPLEDAGGVHGNNESVTVENVKRGTRMMLEIVRAVAEAR